MLHVKKTNWNHCRQKQKLHPLTLLMFQGNTIIFCLASRSSAAKLQPSSQIVNIRLSIHIFTFSITGGLSSQLLPHYQEILLPHPWMLHELIEKEKKKLPAVYFSPCRVWILFSTVVAAKCSFGGKPKLNLAKQPRHRNLPKKEGEKNTKPFYIDFRQDLDQWLSGMMGKNNDNNNNATKTPHVLRFSAVFNVFSVTTQHQPLTVQERFLQFFFLPIFFLPSLRA